MPETISCFGDDTVWVSARLGWWWGELPFWMEAAQLAVAPVGDDCWALKLSSRLERAVGVSDSLPLEKHALSVNQSLSDVAPGNVSALFCLSQKAMTWINEGALQAKIHRADTCSSSR